MTFDPTDRAELCIRKSATLDLGGGSFAWLLDPTTVASVQPDGSLQTRPKTAIGPWETFRVSGAKAVFIDPAYPGGARALAYAADL